jgi:hydroxysqualene synthase
MDAPAAREPVRWSPEEAYAYCEAQTRAHYENFPVASLAVPRSLRPHVCAIYAFARAADDFADEAIHEGRRLEELNRWASRLETCVAGGADHPVFVALGDTLRRFDLPLEPFRDLLDAFRQDCRVRSYASWDDLLDYCRRSANPVGRLLLLLFGHRDEGLNESSDAICTALQLTNFWQDVAVDYRKGRIYLPEDDRRRFGVGEDDLRDGRLHDGFRGLMTEVIARTRRKFAEGRPLLGSLRGRLAVEIRLVWLGGNRILDRIEARGCDVFRGCPRLSGADKARLAGRALLGRWKRP